MNDSDDTSQAGGPQSNDLPKLYSLNGIGFATFFGSMLAGFFLLAANYHALGMKKPAMDVVGAGVLVFCLYFLVVMSFVGPTSMGPTVGQNGAMQFDMTQAILSNVGQVLFLLLVTQVLQGKMLSTFKEDLQGDFHTVTRSIFVSFLAYVVLATFCLILLSLLGLMPEVTNSAVSA